jgi:hypothetical protein
MRAPDAAQFKEAMKNGNEHAREGHWKVISKSDVPSHYKILQAVWSMKH